MIVPCSLIHGRQNPTSSDWPLHKDDCKIIQERGKRENEGEISKRNAGQKKLAKMLYQWTEINSQTVVSPRTPESPYAVINYFLMKN